MTVTHANAAGLEITGTRVILALAKERGVYGSAASGPSPRAGISSRFNEALARHNDKTDYAAALDARLRTGRNLVDRALADFRAAIEQLPGLT